MKKLITILLVLSSPARAEWDTDRSPNVMDGISSSMQRDSDNMNYQRDQIRQDEQLRDQQRQIDLDRARIERRERGF